MPFLLSVVKLAFVFISIIFTLQYIFFIFKVNVLILVSGSLFSGFPFLIPVCFTTLFAAGEVLGDMFEVSRIRREDYEFHKGKSEYEDILQCNNLPSSATPRGHQTPAAFLIMASGLDKV